MLRPVRKILFFAGLIFSASGLLSPPIALVLGLAYGLSFVHPFEAETRSLTKYLLQASVVGLGFGMNLYEVLRVGRSGFVYTALSITTAMLLGLALGWVLRVRHTPSFLISAGTAICGGSAIAAVGPIVDATDEEMAVSLATIFLLNSIALLIFPGIGHAFRMTQTQFGLWSALAIHDTSSVVGAAAKYGPIALAVGTVVKLARALWIVPLSIATAAAKRSKARIQWPWFILFFCLAAVLATYLPHFSSVFVFLSRLGKIGLTVTLFVIGTGLSKETLREVGVRPLMQGILLWVAVAVGVFALIMGNWIHL
jgi:uncharacterized integral membrane protein (TIGR00698 family)